MMTTDNNGQDILEAIEHTTIQIAEIIKSSDSVSESEEMFIGEAVAEQYDYRQTLLEQFNSWYHSAEGQREIRQNNESWNSRIQNLIKADKILVENIHRKMDEAQFRLRTFQQQKSLLIYSNR